MALVGFPMKRVRLACGVMAALLVCLPFPVHSTGRFDLKLPPDKQVVHVLSRLTFGPRPGDAAEIRRTGLDKWIDRQLHPDRIAENPILEERLKTFTTLQLATWQIQEKYPQAPAGLIVRPPSAAAMQ